MVGHVCSHNCCVKPGRSERTSAIDLATPSRLGAWAARKRKKKKVVGAPEVPASAASVPFTKVAPACFDVDRMDTYENEVHDKHRFLHSHSKVWRDLMS